MCKHCRMLVTLAHFGCLKDVRVTAFKTNLVAPFGEKNQEGDNDHIATFSPNGFNCSVYLVVLTSPV